MVTMLWRKMIFVNVLIKNLQEKLANVTEKMYCLAVVGTFRHALDLALKSLYGKIWLAQIVVFRNMVFTICFD